jgi:preprotein translocase subunit Sec63
MMNSRQLGILFFGILVFVLAGLFPPVNRVQTIKVVDKTSGSEEAQEVRSEFHGYRFYFSLNQPQDGEEYRVAKIILVEEWLLLLVAILILMLACRDKKPKLPRERIFQQP